MNEYLSTNPPLGNDDSTQKYAQNEKHNLGESEKESEKDFSTGLFGNCLEVLARRNYILQNKTYQIKV